VVRKLEITEQTYYRWRKEKRHDRRTTQHHQLLPEDDREPDANASPPLPARQSRNAPAARRQNI
jgi:hypothetical protein